MDPQKRLLGTVCMLAASLCFSLGGLSLVGGAIVILGILIYSLMHLQTK